jgi:hypothetical protein
MCQNVIQHKMVLASMCIMPFATTVMIVSRQRKKVRNQDNQRIHTTRNPENAIFHEGSRRSPAEMRVNFQTTEREDTLIQYSSLPTKLVRFLASPFYHRTSRVPLPGPRQVSLSFISSSAHKIQFRSPNN